MLTKRLKSRLAKERVTTSITLRIPVDVVESMKQIAPLRGLAGYQTLLKLYLSEGLRRDEALLVPQNTDDLIEALKKRGVSEKVIREAVQEVGAA